MGYLRHSDCRITVKTKIAHVRIKRESTVMARLVTKKVQITVTFNSEVICFVFVLLIGQLLL